MIYSLVTKKIFSKKIYQLIIVLMMSINISMSLFFLSLGFNAVSYFNIYLEQHDYYKTVTYFENIDTNYTSRNIQIEYIDSVKNNHIIFDIFRMGYTDSSYFLLESENDISFTGSMDLSEGKAIVLKSAFQGVEINDDLEIDTGDHIMTLTVSGIIEDDGIYLRSNYPEIYVFNPVLNQIDIKTVELNDYQTLEDFDLNHTINYRSEYKQIDLLKDVVILISLSLTIFFFVIIFISFFSIFKNILNDHKALFYLLKFLGMKKIELYQNFILICSIYHFIAFLLSIGLVYLFNYVILDMIEISLLIDQSIFSSNIHIKAIFIVLLFIIISIYILTKKSFSFIEKAGDEYV